MNPFTKFLNRGKNSNLNQFIEHWDRVEYLAVAVFKAKGASGEESAEYAQSRKYLLDTYPSFQQALAPLWADTLVGGEIAGEDPFLRVLNAETADGFVGDWVALQNLPAAREALNKLVLAQKG